MSNEQTDVILTVTDCRNLVAMLTRMQFNGLAEAEAGLHIAYKLRAAKVRELPPQVKDGQQPDAADKPK